MRSESKSRAKSQLAMVWPPRRISGASILPLRNPLPSTRSPAVPALQAPMVRGALVAAGLTANEASVSDLHRRDVHGIRAIADAGEPAQSPGIETRLDLIPGEWTQRLSGRDRGETALPVAKPEGEGAVLVEDQGVAGSGRFVPFGQDAPAGARRA